MLKCLSCCSSTEKHWIFTLPILQISKARSALKIAILSLNRRPARPGKRTPVVLLVDQVPLCSCVVEIVLWWKLPCNTLTVVWAPAQTDCQCRACLRPRDCSVGRTMTPSQAPIGANYTNMWSQQGKKDQTSERRGLCHLGRFESCLKVGKSKAVLWSHILAGHKFTSSWPDASKFPASPHARDDVEQRPPLRTPRK